MTLKEFISRRSQLWKAFMNGQFAAIICGVTGLIPWDELVTAMGYIGSFVVVCKIWDVK